MSDYDPRSRPDPYGQRYDYSLEPASGGRSTFALVGVLAIFALIGGLMFFANPKPADQQQAQQPAPTTQQTPDTTPAATPTPGPTPAPANPRQ